MNSYKLIKSRNTKSKMWLGWSWGWGLGQDQDQENHILESRTCNSYHKIPYNIVEYYINQINDKDEGISDDRNQISINLNQFNNFGAINIQNSKKKKAKHMENCELQGICVNFCNDSSQTHELEKS